MRLLNYFLLPVLGYSASRTGSFTTQPYAANGIMRFSFSFFGEGIEYDYSRDRVLLGTLSNSASTVPGRIYAVPYVNPSIYEDNDNNDNFVEFGESDMTLIFYNESMSGVIKSIAGLQMDHTDPDVVWAATGTFPATTTSSCGVAKIDISTGMLLQYIDLSGLKGVTGICMPNDLVFDTAGDLYVTDFFGYQVWKIATSTDFAVSVIADEISALCDQATGTCNPADGFDFNGPNGIEYVNGKLIVSVSGTKIISIDLQNASAIAVVAQFPQDGVQGCDGIIFDAAKETLYIAGSGTTGSILAATSDDDWQSLTIHVAYNANCLNDGVTTLAIASNSDILAFCSNGFGAAPYNISVLSEVVGNVDGGKIFMSKSSDFSTTEKNPEGIAYHKKNHMLVVGSMATGTISGVSASFAGVSFSDADVFRYVSGSATVYGTVGLEMDDEDDTGCLMYAAVGNYNGDSSVAGGLAYYNLCTSTILNYVSFASVMAGGSMFVNDVVVEDGDEAYLTDSFGEQIILVEDPYKASATPEVFMANFCTFPNGIVVYDDDYLLVGCSDGIYRVKIDKKEKVKVADASHAIGNVDGMFFGDDEDILYVVIGRNRIAAVSSKNDWETLDLLYIFNAGCGNDMPATITTAGSSLFALCLGADNGPYEIRFVEDVDDVVTDGNGVYGTNAEEDDEDDDDFDIKKWRIAVIVLASFCIVLLILVISSAVSMRNMHKARYDNKDAGMSMSAINNNPDSSNAT